MKKPLFLIVALICATAVVTPTDATASNGLLLKGNIQHPKVFGCGSCGTYCNGQTIGATVCLDGLSSAGATQLACDLLMAVHLSGQCDS